MATHQASCTACRRASQKSAFAIGSRWPAPCLMDLMVGCKCFHIRNERLYAFERHRIVDRCTHAADRLVPLQLQQAGLSRTGKESGVVGFVAQEKR